MLTKKLKDIFKISSRYKSQNFLYFAKRIQSAKTLAGESVLNSFFNSLSENAFIKYFLSETLIIQKKQYYPKVANKSKEIYLRQYSLKKRDSFRFWSFFIRFEHTSPFPQKEFKGIFNKI